MQILSRVPDIEQDAEEEVKLPEGTPCKIDGYSSKPTVFSLRGELWAFCYCFRVGGIGGWDEHDHALGGVEEGGRRQVALHTQR